MSREPLARGRHQRAHGPSPFVRHEIMPRAKERNPQLLETLGRTMDLIADEDDFMEVCRGLQASITWVAPGGGSRP